MLGLTAADARHSVSEVQMKMVTRLPPLRIRRMPIIMSRSDEMARQSSY